MAGLCKSWPDDLSDIGVCNSPWDGCTVYSAYCSMVRSGTATRETMGFGKERRRSGGCKKGGEKKEVIVDTRNIAHVECISGQERTIVMDDRMSSAVFWLLMALAATGTGSCKKRQVLL